MHTPKPMLKTLLMTGSLLVAALLTGGCSVLGSAPAEDLLATEVAAREAATATALAQVTPTPTSPPPTATPGPTATPTPNPVPELALARLGG